MMNRSFAELSQWLPYLQVNLDFSSEADMIRKFRAGLALQPVSYLVSFSFPYLFSKSPTLSI